jgi:hypothetical protein
VRLPVVQPARITIRQAVRSLRAQLAADSARLCASPGHACADYSPDADYVCRHHLRRADTGARACVLGLVEDAGEMPEAEVAAILGLSDARISQIVAKGRKLLATRAKLRGLHAAIDVDRFAGSRRPIEIEPEDDDGPRRFAVVDVILRALRSGPMTLSDIARTTGTGHLPRTMRRLEQRGLVVRAGDAWALAPVQCDRGAA